MQYSWYPIPCIMSFSVILIYFSAFQGQFVVTNLVTLFLRLIASFVYCFSTLRVLSVVLWGDNLRQDINITSYLMHYYLLLSILVTICVNLIDLAMVCIVHYFVLHLHSYNYFSLICNSGMVFALYYANN